MSGGAHRIVSPVVIDGILRQWGDYLFYKPPKRGSIKTLCHYRLPPETPKVSPLSIRQKLALTTGKAPEVVVKISGGGKNLTHIKSHLDYIARQGEVPLEDEQGDVYQGLDDLREIEQAWGLSKYGIPREGERRREAFNIVLSMPPGTPREAVSQAVRQFARERFFNHQYVFATHEDEAHPHVHLCVKALDKTQVRLNPRKSDLQQWREHFAQKLREQGVEANATPRRARGVVKRPEKQVIRHLQKRGEIALSQAQYQSAIVEEILTGVPHQNPRGRNILYARKETVKAYGEMANALAASEHPEDLQLSLAIVRFLQNLPPSQSVHEQVVAGYHQQPPRKSSSGATQTPRVICAEAFGDMIKKAIATLHSEKKAAYPRIDLARLKADLNGRALEVAEHYLGKPKHQKGKTWRYGSKQGSLAVTVSGDKQGTWYDFQTGEGGDMLSLIQSITSCSDFKETLKEAERFLGGISSVKVQRNTTQPIKNPDQERLQKIQKAQMILSQTQPVLGTLGERYLKEHRGIEMPLCHKNIRYHPKLKHWMTGEFRPALVIPSYNAQGEVQGIQAIFLEEDSGRKKSGAYAKLSRGQMGGGALVHQGHSGKVALAEGLETALSVAMAKPDWTVYVTFGVSNIEKVAKASSAQEIIICADNDGHPSSTGKVVEKAAKMLSDQGVLVWIAKPEKPAHLKAWDFNDVLLLQGIDQIQQDLAKATGYPPEKEKDKIFSQEIAESIQSMPLSALLSCYVEMELNQQKIQNPHDQIVHEHLIREFSKASRQRSDVQHETLKSYTRIEALPKTRQDFQAIQARAVQSEFTREDQRALLLSLLKRSHEPSALLMEQTRLVVGEKGVDVPKER